MTKRSKTLMIEKHRKEAHAALDAFLDDYRESDGGYSLFTKEDEQNFWKFYRAMREAKFETDPDGDMPMEIVLINRTRQERLHYFTQEYLHRMTTPVQVAEYIHNAESNVSIAAQDVRSGILKLKDMLKEKQS